MLTQYPHYKFYLVVYFSLNIFIFCDDRYVSDWGYFTVENQSLTIENQEIIDVVNDHTTYMNSKFGNIQRLPFIIIISNKEKNLYNNNTWNWSLGITINNTIIIKD